jgi:hypothetical protein
VFTGKSGGFEYDWIFCPFDIHYQFNDGFAIPGNAIDPSQAAHALKPHLISDKKESI